MRETAIKAPPSPYNLKTGSLSSHGRIVSLMESLGAANRVLDVGTATGYLGAMLHQRGFRHLTGVERNHQWAAQARPFYEAIEALDIEVDALPWPAGFFDVIICADVLEHVRAPEQILKRLLPLIKPGGRLILSMPNVAHWSMRVSLLLGRFDYVDSGILDRDHLRFFTRASARRMLRSAGLTIQGDMAIPLPIAHWCSTMPQAALLWRALERLDWCLGLLWPALFAYQFVYIARVPGASLGNQND